MAIRNYADTPDIRKRAARLVKACIQEAKKKRLSIEAEWRDARLLWMRHSVSDIFPPDEIKHKPEPFNRVETIVPRIHSGVFGVGPWFTAQAKRKDFIVQEPSLVQVTLTQLEMDDWRFYSDQEDGIRIMAVEGSVFYKSDWISREDNVAERKTTHEEIRTPGGELLGTQIKHGDLQIVKETVAYPRHRPLENDNVLVDRFCGNIQECRYIGDLFELTLAEVEQRAQKGRYLNTENLKESLRKKMLGKSQRSWDQMVPELEPVKLWEWWTSMELDGDYCRVVVIIGEDLTEKVVLSIKKNTFPGGMYPYSVGRYIKRPGEIYGVGAIIPIKGLSQELDEYATIQSRALELAISPPFISRDLAEIDQEALHLFPGRVIHSPMGKEGLQTIQIPLNAMAIQPYENAIRRDIAQTSRAPDIWGGMGETGRETAYEVGKRLQESGLSLARIIARYRNEVLKPILRNHLALNHMYLTTDLQIRILGAKGVQGRVKPFLEIKPQDIQAQFDFKILDISEIAMLGDSARSWVNFMRALPEAAWPRLKWNKVLEDFLKAIGKENREDYLVRETDAEDLQSPVEDHQLISAEHTPPVFPEHNHFYHIAQHKLFRASPAYEKWTPQKKKMLEIHMNRHLLEMDRQRAQALKPAEQMALGGLPPEGARPQQGPAGPRGRPTMPGVGTPADALRRAATQNQGQ